MLATTCKTCQAGNSCQSWRQLVTYQTKPTKPSLQNQTYQTKPSKPNPKTPRGKKEELECLIIRTENKSVAVKLKESVRERSACQIVA